MLDADAEIANLDKVHFPFKQILIFPLRTRSQEEDRRLGLQCIGEFALRKLLLTPPFV